MDDEGGDAGAGHCALGTLMMVPAVLVALYAPGLSVAAAWFTAALLAAFGVLGFVLVSRELAPEQASA